MGIDQWELEEMGILIVFPHTSNSNSGEQKLTRKNAVLLNTAWDRRN